MARATAAPPLTAIGIKNLKAPATGRLDVADGVTPGLCLRVTANDVRTWTLRMRDAAGELRRFNLGKLTDTQGLAWARLEAADMRQDVRRNGKDPKREATELKKANAAAKKAEAEQAERDRVTLGKLVVEWGTARVAKAGRRLGYVQEAERALRFAFRKQWAMPAASLDWDMVARALDVGTPVMAARTMTYGRACYGWAIKNKKGSVTTNPFTGHDVAAVVQRERVLDDAELADVWRASLNDTGVFGPIVRLLILTGQRREEVAGMAWGELAPDLSAWTLPAARAKNKAAHIVPLSALAQAELLKDRGVQLVFPGEGERHPQFQGWSRAKERLDANVAATRAELGQPPMSPWRLHDLRRTCATGLQRLGVRLEVTEATLNHVSGTRRGIVGTYQRHHWADEKRAALDAWAQHVQRSTSGQAGSNNVVALPRRAIN